MKAIKNFFGNKNKTKRAMTQPRVNSSKNFNTRKFPSSKKKKQKEPEPMGMNFDFSNKNKEIDFSLGNQLKYDKNEDPQFLNEMNQNIELYQIAKQRLKDMKKEWNIFESSVQY